MFGDIPVVCSSSLWANQSDYFAEICVTEIVARDWDKPEKTRFNKQVFCLTSVKKGNVRERLWFTVNQRQTLRIGILHSPVSWLICGDLQFGSRQRPAFQKLVRDGKLASVQYHGVHQNVDHLGRTCPGPWWKLNNHIKMRSPFPALPLTWTQTEYGLHAHWCGPALNFVGRLRWLQKLERILCFNFMLSELE